jgi:hypothetical protein
MTAFLRRIGSGVGIMLAVMPPAFATPDFAQAWLPEDVRQVAHWAYTSGDPGGRSVVIVDKKQARVFVLDPVGRFQGVAPVLLGSARGDHTVPGVGDKPLSQVLPEERTTPAGRFIAEPGVNAQGEDIIWIDYAAAISMHRVRTRVQAERRLQRLASPTPDDNRISYGCINLPHRFYEEVLAPRARSGAVVYVLPETRPHHEVFESGGATTRPAGTVRHRLLTATDGTLNADH